VIVTSIIATFDDAMIPVVGPAAQARPARNVHRTRSARKRTRWPPVR
jgi:hypothetical protein